MVVYGTWFTRQLGQGPKLQSQSPNTRAPAHSTCDDDARSLNRLSPQGLEKVLVWEILFEILNEVGRGRCLHTEPSLNPGFPGNMLRICWVLSNTGPRKYTHSNCKYPPAGRKHHAQAPHDKAERRRSQTWHTHIQMQAWSMTKFSYAHCNSVGTAEKP